MHAHSVRASGRPRLPLFCLLALATAISTLVSAGCGSSASSSDKVSASPIGTAIIKLLPRDASVEPPWNGRFVQVNVRADEPQSMDPADWRVFVNGMEPELDKSPSVLPYATHEAVVAFTFQAPYGDPGTYEFRVVYAPEDGQKVERSWDYKW